MKGRLTAGAICLSIGALLSTVAGVASLAGSNEMGITGGSGQILGSMTQPPATPLPDEPKRKNTRPLTISAATADRNTQTDAALKNAECDPCYEYSFKQLDRNIEFIKIVHNSAGKGFIVFSGRRLAEEMREPLQLSEVIIAKIRTAFAGLNFLKSTEDYQFEKDYSHLGTVTITLRDGDRQRTVRFNWTTNPLAKALMDEYRRISQREIWLFEFSVARENQPLETIALLDSFESLLDRNEIADPVQILPVFRRMEIDERLPLIARNHASRIIRKIEKLRVAN